MDRITTENMLFFYNSFYWLLFSCGSSFIVFVGVTVFLLKRYRQISVKSLLILFGITALAFVVSSNIFIGVGRDLQMTVAEPYIQQALDQECGQGVFHTTEGRLYNESGYYWQANTSLAQCFYNGRGWVCSCSSK